MSQLSSCDSSKGIENPEEGENNTGTFIVTSLRGSSHISQVDEYELPTQKIYNFEVCLQDKLHRRNVNNQPFEVMSGNKVIASDVSNERSCFYWSEHVNYNFTHDSNYLTLKRTLKATGTQKGTYKLKMAINPWLHGELFLPEVINLDQQEVVARLDEEASIEKMNRDGNKPIYIKDMALRFNEVSFDQGVNYSVEMILTPTLFLKNTKDQDVLEDILGGEYEINFAIIHEMIKNGATQKNIIARTQNITGTSLRGKLVTNFMLNVKNVPTDGFYRGVLTIKPKLPSRKLLQGESVFDLGAAGNITAISSARPMGFVELARGDYQVNKYIDPVQKNDTGQDESYLNAGIYVKENLKLSFSRFDNETTTERDVVFDVTACLGRTGGKAIGQRTIEVHKVREDGNNKRMVAFRPLMTNQCITWEDSFRHKYFMPERKVLKTFQLKNKDIGLDVSVPVLINPWDFGWTFGRFATLQEAEVIERERAAVRPASKFYLRDYRFVEEGTNYLVNNELTLTQMSKIRFSLDVKVERSSSQTRGVNQVEKLRKGQYLFRVLVRRNDVENSDRSLEYITHAQTITTVIDGNMIADVVLPLMDQGVLRSRNRILIELATVNEDLIEPIDEIHYRPKSGFNYDDVIDVKSGLDRAVFEGPIILSNATYSNRVREYLLNDFVTVKSNFIKQYEESKSNDFIRYLIPNLNLPSDNDLSQHISIGLMQVRADKNITKSLARKYPEHNRLNYFNISKEKNNLLQELEKGQIRTRDKLELNDITNERFEKFIDNPHSDMDLKKIMCRYFAHHLLDAQYFNNKDLVRSRNGGYTTRFDIMMSCYRELSPNFAEKLIGKIRGKRSVLGAFTFVRQYITNKVSYIDHLKGIPYSYSIGTGYSLGMSKKIGLDAGVKIPLGSIFGISGGGGISGGVGWSQGLTTRTGFGLNLSVEENIEKLRFHKPKKCLVMRFSKKLLKELAINLSKFKRDHGEEAYQSAQGHLHTTGLLLCHDTKSDINKKEHYYYLEQNSGPGILQDVTDERNRQVKIKLRGQSEFFTFIENFEGELKNPMSVFTKPELFGSIYDFMNNHINMTPANYPGVYTDLNESIKIRDQYLAL